MTRWHTYYARNGHTHSEESSPDGGLFVFLEVVLNESKHYRGLSDRGFTKQNEFGLERFLGGGSGTSTSTSTDSLASSVVGSLS